MQTYPSSNIPCKIYNPETRHWEPFTACSVQVVRDGPEIFKYRNSKTFNQTYIHKQITHDYIAYFSRVLPNSLSPQHFGPSESLEKPRPGYLDHDDIGCILVLEDLTLRYSSLLHEDQFILFGFQTNKEPPFGTNKEVQFIQNIISEAHFQLKFSESGIVHQVSQRVNTMLYKTVKYATCAIAELFNVHPSFSTGQKLRNLQKMSRDPTFRDYLFTIINSPAFLEELTSHTYKTITQVGLFPLYIEVNTMDEIRVWVKIKSLLSRLKSDIAPYGANHHASFCMGNFRYSYVFEPTKKTNQKVSINLETKRGFRFKNKGFKYFRLKFLDFFPMDSWVTELASAAAKTIAMYIEKTSHIALSSDGEDESLKIFMKYVVDAEEALIEQPNLFETIAKKFYARYNEELDVQRNDQIFRKVASVITECEFKGYDNISNNCQTIVVNALEIIGGHFQKFMEPLVQSKNLTSMPDQEDSMEPQNTKADFLKFGNHFNFKFTDIRPFPIDHKLAYFQMYVDKDTTELLATDRFKSVHKYMKKYLIRENVSRFLEKFEKSLTMYAKIYRAGSIKNKSFIRVDDEEDNINHRNIITDDNYGMAACLMHIEYNELFNIKRIIKIAKYCKTKLNNFKIAHRNKEVKKLDKGTEEKVQRWEELVNKLPELYAEKYRIQAVYRELQYYYHNTIRLGVKSKSDDSLSYIGSMLVRKPDGSDQDCPSAEIVRSSTSIDDSQEMIKERM